MNGQAVVIECEDGIFDERGLGDWQAIYRLKRLHEQGVLTVLRTNKTREELTDLIQKCTDYGLYFDAINTLDFIGDCQKGFRRYGRSLSGRIGA